MSPPPVLEIRDLTRRFGPILAVDRLNLALAEGEILGFLGQNGAGKTTTLRMVTGLLRPTAGRVAILGKPASAGQVQSRERLGAFIEGPSFFPRLTGRENLLLLGGLSARVAPAEVDALLEEVGIAAAARRRAHTYSLGMKQRLGIALALLPRPRVVLLDEPTNGLDPEGILHVRTMIKRRQKEDGTSFLVSSHLLAEVEMTCSRIAILREGRLVREGPLETILAPEDADLVVEAEPEAAALSAATRAVGPDRITRDGRRIVVSKGAADAALLAQRLVEAGCAIRHLAPRRPTLEEIFFQEARR